MQVTSVKPVLVDAGTGKNWLFVKVDTDAGISGWGECYTQADRDHAIVAHVHKNLDALAKKAAETVALGFTALKLDPFPDPWRTHIDRKTELAAVDNLRAVREAVGQEVDILTDGSCR